MVRATNTPSTHRRRKKIISLAKGYCGARHKLYKAAKEQLMRSWAFAYRDRKCRRRNLRRIWITRLNNALREKGLNYSTFICALKLAHIRLNRHQLSELANEQPEAFSSLVKKVIALNLLTASSGNLTI